MLRLNASIPGAYDPVADQQMVSSINLLNNKTSGEAHAPAFDSNGDGEVFSQTLTPKIYPTNAESPIATVPQITIRATALSTLEPPVFAEIAPRITNETIVKP